MIRVAYWSALAAAALGCGASPEAPQAPSAVTSKAITPLLPPAVNLGPVAAPATLVVTGRLAKPNASLGTIRGWSKLPMPQSAQATEALLGEALGNLIDLDQPIDFAVAVGSDSPKKAALGLAGFDNVKPRLVVSAALQDPEAAKAALSERFKLVRGEGGVLSITGLGRTSHAEAPPDESEESDGEPTDHESCELAPAYGPSAMRLLCAWGDPGSLAELGPWLTRGATRAVATADLHVDVRMEPLKALFGTGLKSILSVVGGLVSGSVGLSSPRDLVMGILSEMGDFLLDLEDASLDIELSEPEARAVKTLTFTGRSSAITRLATANADRNAPPPPTFWQMPGDATFAFFERGIDERELGQGRTLVLNAIAEQLTQEGVKPADRTAIVDALGKLPPAAPLVYAAGVDGAAVQKALASWVALGGGTSPLEHFEAMRGAVEAGFGWHIVELDETSTDISAAMKALTAAWSRPGVVAAYRSKSGDTPAPLLRALPLSRRPGGDPWPKDALHFTLELPPPKLAGSPGKVGAKDHGATRAIALHGLIVPDGVRTWVGVGSEETFVAGKLAAAMNGTGETLAARAELGPLRDALVASGGFISLRGLAASTLPGMALSGSAEDASEVF